MPGRFAWARCCRCLGLSCLAPAACRGLSATWYSVDQQESAGTCWSTELQEAVPAHMSWIGIQRRQTSAKAVWLNAARIRPYDVGSVSVKYQLAVSLCPDHWLAASFWLNWSPSTPLPEYLSCPSLPSLLPPTKIHANAHAPCHTPLTLPSGSTQGRFQASVSRTP